MKNLTYTIILLISVTSCAQKKETEIIRQKMIPMSATVQKKDKLSNYLYYERGSNEPYTGILYGKYGNGNFLTMQEYKDGLGNGYWIDFDPEGNMECKGTYINNKVEGPVTFYYEDGSIKSKGQYLHWKKPTGKWIYYDKKGNVVHEMYYTY
uniref:toxin-antitoxin system YwqK family antitoxin n=1 Tax=Flavobacterium sp. TaxID=239 RepID=UPI00404986BD